MPSKTALRVIRKGAGSRVPLTPENFSALSA